MPPRPRPHLGGDLTQKQDLGRSEPLGWSQTGLEGTPSNDQCPCEQREMCTHTWKATWRRRREWHLQGRTQGWHCHQRPQGARPAHLGAVKGYISAA